ncbi:MAG: DEAD/DEAH box helicase family protein [Syntrophobacteraceae bacterium]|nr:DEAD/DEAH box helicase family protein [Syntrophobacteraceae bacterium]
MFTKNINVLLAEWIKVPVDGLPPIMEKKLHERLVFTNPEYEMRHNSGEWLGNIPAQISCFKQKGRNYLIPRGFLDQFLDLCKRYQVSYRLVDRRRHFDPIELEFHGELKSYQQEAAEAVLEHDCATLVGGHKSGKTVIALYTAAQRRQPTLIVVPRADLFDGWLKKIEGFLQVPASEVGIFSSGTQEIGKWITIGHIGEVMRHWRKIFDKVGYIIFDESQRSPAKILTNLLPNFDCRYILGLSNTLQRKDRLLKLIHFYLGEVVYSIDEKDAREGRGIIPGTVIARRTDFDYPYSSRADYQPMLQGLMVDSDRNSKIADDVETELGKGEKPLVVLSGGEDQEVALGAELGRRGITVFPYSQLSAGPGNSGMAEGGNGNSVGPGASQAQVLLVSPGSMAQCSRTLRSHVVFLAVPVYFQKNLSNAIRDISRDGETADSRLTIYDYVDTRVGILDNYFRMRSYNYGVHPDLLLGGQAEAREAMR